MPLLGLQRERRYRARLQASKRDRFAGLFAIAVGALVDTAQRLIDLGYQFALAVARAQLKPAVGFASGAIGEIRLSHRILLEGGDGAAALFEDLFFPGLQFRPEILLLPLIHERLV